MILQHALVGETKRASLVIMVYSRTALLDLFKERRPSFIIYANELPITPSRSRVNDRHGRDISRPDQSLKTFLVLANDGNDITRAIGVERNRSGDCHQVGGRNGIPDSLRIEAVRARNGIRQDLND
jgi:hypothetical protein